MRRLFAMAALAALIPGSGPAAAQQPPAASPTPGSGLPKTAPERAFPPVVESVDVSVTSVEVIVTDSKGNRVPGLTAADFEVRQDGVAQKITNFYAVTGGKLLLDDGSVVDLADKQEAVEVPREVKARYVFYIDNLNIQAMNRNRMFKRLREFVREVIGPNAEGMVVTFNRSLKVRRQFTSEVNDILGAIDQIELESAGGTTAKGEWKDTLDRIANAKSSSEATSAVRTYAQSVRNDMEFTIDAVKETIDSMAGLQGRKSLLYMSEGLPASAGYELFDAVREKFQDTSATMEQFDFDLSTKYVKIVQAANANGVTIYTLDASGLTTSDVMSADSRTRQEVHVDDFQARQNMQGPIKMIAQETGGQATVNSNDWKAGLDAIAADFSNYYSIGFRTARGVTDRPHKIDVSVSRKGLRVRTRASYVEKSVETRTAEAVVASLAYPRDDNPLGGQPLGRRCEAARPPELRVADPGLGADRQAGPGARRGSIRRTVPGLLRGARRLRESVGPLDPAPGSPRSGQGHGRGPAQGLLLRRDAPRRPGRPGPRRGRAGHGFQPDLVPAQAGLRVGSPSGGETIAGGRQARRAIAPGEESGAGG